MDPQDDRHVEGQRLVSSQRRQGMNRAKSVASELCLPDSCFSQRVSCILPGLQVPTVCSHLPSRQCTRRADGFQVNHILIL